MAHDLCVAAALSLTLLLAGCGGSPEAPPAAEAPAHVENAATEASLTTVTLTPQAVERLAIETVEITSASVGQTRSYAGVFEVPSGRSFRRDRERRDDRG